MALRPIICEHGVRGRSSCPACHSAMNRRNYERYKAEANRQCVCGCGTVLSEKSRSGYTKAHNPFCTAGHDKRLVGMRRDGKCGACCRERDRIRYVLQRRKNPVFMARASAQASQRYAEIISKARAYDALMAMLADGGSLPGDGPSVLSSTEGAAT